MSFYASKEVKLNPEKLLTTAVFPSIYVLCTFCHFISEKLNFLKLVNVLT